MTVAGRWRRAAGSARTGGRGTAGGPLLAQRRRRVVEVGPGRSDRARSGAGDPCEGRRGGCAGTLSHGAHSIAGAVAAAVEEPFRSAGLDWTTASAHHYRSACPRIARRRNASRVAGSRRVLRNGTHEHLAAVAKIQDRPGRAGHRPGAALRTDGHHARRPRRLGRALLRAPAGRRPARRRAGPCAGAGAGLRRTPAHRRGRPGGGLRRHRRAVRGLHRGGHARRGDGPGDGARLRTGRPAGRPRRARRRRPAAHRTGDPHGRRRHGARLLLAPRDR